MRVAAPVELSPEQRTALQRMALQRIGRVGAADRAQQIAVDRPELVRRLVLVGTGPRGGDGMGQLAPDGAPLFGKAYDPQDLMWLPIFFAVSDESQAAGRRFLERIRARTEDRDVPVSEATVAAHSAAAGDWGLAAPGSFGYLNGIDQPTLVVSGGTTTAAGAIAKR